MITRIEQEFYARVPNELVRIAKSLEKLAKSEEAKTEVSVDVPMKDSHPIESPFDVLAVTDVKVFPCKDSLNLGHLKGLASVVLNDQLQIRNLRVMEYENGMFVGYPTDPFYKGEDLRCIYFPMTRQLKEHIENCVLEKYKDVTEG